MKRIITIATSDYFKYTRRLLISLIKTNRDFELTVFCDAEDVFKPLERLGHCKIVALPEITRLGVKRAKFKAYVETAKKSDFLFLDSDIIVLDDLDEMFGKSEISGCFDDLMACDFIPDKIYPWNDRSLKNDIYINSGVFFAPRSRFDFFEKIHRLSLQDETWAKYILGEKLQDNHFLCAMINLHKIKVDYLDQNVYNWQGLTKNDKLQAYRDGHSLVNVVAGKKMKIIHFAGIRDMDDFIMRLPIEVSSLLCEQMILNDPLQEEPALTYLASMSSSLSKRMEDFNVPRIVQDFFREANEIRKTSFLKDYSWSDTYLMEKGAAVSWAYGKPITSFKWNGLSHGGSYLTGDEYGFMRKFVAENHIQSVLETGAGETSILFHHLTGQSFAIEPSPGPWFEKAKAAGCQVTLVDFVPENFQFSEEQLSAFFDQIRMKEFDLFFLDSPIGTKNRCKVLEQMLRFTSFKYILIHDAYRDAENIFSFQKDLGYQLIDYFPSERGMVLLGKSNIKLDTSTTLLPDVQLQVRNPDYVLKYLDPDQHLTKAKKFKVRIEITNTSNFPFSSQYANPIHVSYHWLDTMNNVIVHDGERTKFPFILDTQDRGEFTIEVVAPDKEGDYILQVDLVQEGIAWFQGLNPRLCFLKHYSVCA